MRNTPSERTHFKIDPFSTFGANHSKEHPLLIFLKNIVGSGIPFLFSAYLIACMVHVKITFFLGFFVATLTFFYVLLDRFGKKQEIPLFYIGSDLWLLALLVVAMSGLLINASQVHFWPHFKQMSWVFLLYFLTYAFYLFPGIKRFFHILTVSSFLLCIYGLIQHFTGIDLAYDLGLRKNPSIYMDTYSQVYDYLLPISQGRYQIIGFFENHVIYGYLLSMVLCFPMAGIFLLNDIALKYRLFLIATCALISLNLLWTYSKGVWIAAVVSQLFMSGFVSRKLFVKILLLIAITFGGFYYLDHSFQKNAKSILSSNHQGHKTQMDIWKANVAMFLDYPWFGIGLEQNEVHIRRYYQKLNIDNWKVSHAHNTYISWLATTGIFGLLAYMLFILTFLLITARLWIEIPSTNRWHRVFVLALLGVQISMHVGGLTEWTFGAVVTQHFFIFALAMASYMYRKYNEASVFDDHCL